MQKQSYFKRLFNIFIIILLFGNITAQNSGTTAKSLNQGASTQNFAGTITGIIVGLEGGNKCRINLKEYPDVLFNLSIDDAIKYGLVIKTGNSLNTSAAEGKKVRINVAGSSVMALEEFKSQQETKTKSSEAQLFSKEKASFTNSYPGIAENQVALGNILKSLLPVMVFNTNNQASLKQQVTEDEVIEKVIALIKQGVRIDSLRIINFKNSSKVDYGSFSQVTTGEFGQLVSVTNGKTGITLIEYCEEVNCLKIAKVFMDEISRLNNLLLVSNKELSGLKLKAEKGDVNSQLELGKIFRDGVSPLEKDYPGSVRWYQMAADKGSAIAQYSLADMYTFKKIIRDYDKAFLLYTKSAEQGNPEAINMVGMCYMSGIGVTVDKAEAIKWWVKASEAGNANAQASLGSCYEKGIGVTQDYAEAVKWYTKAAEQGNAVGQGALGVLYFLGKGVPKDVREAEKWFTKGAEQGNETCRRNLEYIKTQTGK